MAYQPAQWLRNLAQNSPAPYWPWRHSLRLALLTSVPMSIGLWTGHAAPAMIVCLGGLLTGVTVQTDPYPDRFRRIMISAPIGMSGYIIGSCISDHNLWTIFGITCVAFISGLLSGYGAAFSVGALQMLVMTIIASHVPITGPIWMMPALFLSGACFALLLLTIEAAISPKRPERAIVATLLQSLSNLARVEAQQNKHPAERDSANRSITSAQSKAYSALMRKQQLTHGRSVAGDWGAAILALADRIAALLNTHKADNNTLLQAADLLDGLARRIMNKEQSRPQQPPTADTTQLLYNVERMAQAVEPLIQEASFSWMIGQLKPNLQSFSFSPLWQKRKLLPNLLLGRDVITSALRLAFCILIALFAEHYALGNRSYWIPLSVAVILKPDFGSIFVRAIQRSTGTFIGVLIAAAIIELLPKDFSLVIAIAILSALIPWAALKSYALQCTFLTPLILILLDLIITGKTADFSMERLIDTVIATAIVLIFGFLLWPKRHEQSIKQNFSNALITIADYLRSTLDAHQSDGSVKQLFDHSVSKRRMAYTTLSDLRTHLQRALSEPPPSSTRALAWLPAVSAAERICDHVTTYMLLQDENEGFANDAEVQYLADLMDKIATNNEVILENGKFTFTSNTSEKITKHSSLLIEIYQNIENIYNIYLKK